MSKNKTELEVEIEDTQDQVIELENEVTEVEEPTEIPEPEVTEQEVEVQEKPSRAKERIHELWNEKRQKEEKLREIELENEALKQRSAETEKLYAARMKDILETNLEKFKEARNKALEEADAVTFSAMEDKIAEVRNELADIEKVNARYADEKPVQKQNRTPTAAQQWAVGKEFLLDNEAYVALPKSRRIAALKLRGDLQNIAADLIKQGFNPENPSFYDEVDFRMERKYPNYEALASEGADALDYFTEEDIPSVETQKPNTNKSNSEKAKALPVRKTNGDLGGERGKNINRVNLTPEEMAFYNRHLAPSGVTLTAYAKKVLESRNKDN